MNISFNLPDSMISLQNAILFFRKHFLIIIGLGLISAMGRVVQLGGLTSLVIK
jgi:hypothetical protein